MSVPPAPKTILDGKYELIAPVGMGGMASVWRALTRGAAGFSRNVAVKRILPKHRNDEYYVQMFVEEARVGSELVHQNLVQVYDFCGSREQGYFLVMEWVDGCSLEALVRSYAPEHTPWDELSFVVASALNGLAAAHDRMDESGNPRPIIHRDVSPGNILVNIRGEAKLGDFGLAKAQDRKGMPTLPGMLKGKPSYLAPEVLREQKPDVASDIYAMGVTLWEALASRKLYSSEGEFDMIRSIVAGSYTPIDELRDDLPSELVELIHRAISTDPQLRPGSASDFADELFALLDRSQRKYLKARLAEHVRSLRA